MAEITVQPGQSILDIATQYYGHAHGVLDILQRNKLNGIVDNIHPGDVLTVSDTPENPRVVSFLAAHVLATMEEAIRADGIGWMGINKDFEIGKQ